jgi:uncharacterized protein (DUF1330 family)
MISSPRTLVFGVMSGRTFMKTRYTVVLSMIAGAALGGAAIQGLHAQVKKVYFISESEVVDRAAVPAWNTSVQKAIKDAGGSLVVGENITAVLGDPPKRRLRPGSTLRNVRQCSRSVTRP